MEMAYTMVTDLFYNAWEGFLGVVEPHLPEHLHWNELCWTFVYYLAEVRLWIHKKTRGLEHWEIVVNTATYCFYLFLMFELLRWIIGALCKEGPISRFKRFFFKLLRKMPYVGNQIQAQVEQAKADLVENIFDLKGHTYKSELPQKGLSADAIKEEVVSYKQLIDSEWSDGLVSGTVYSGTNELSDLMTKVYSEHVWSNPLHSDVFPDVRKMEAEVVRMTLKLFHGDEQSCGLMTTGGTESIFLACLAYREIGKEKGIESGEILAAYSVHPAFDKAAHYLGMTIKHIPVDAKTGKADVRAMRKAINRNTVMIVGSCPSFPHGCIDPIQDLGKLARKYKLGFHVDCCLGGFVVPFMEQAGYKVPPFDFAVPEVTSISADTHKYAFAPKGSSILMYKSTSIRKHQFFVQSDWSGGVYASPSMPGSRAGNIIATTWASFLYHGVEGYVKSTKAIVHTTKWLSERLARIPGIKTLGSPDVCVVAFTSDDFDIFRLSEQLCKHGWKLTPLQFPSGLHLSVTMLHTKPEVRERLVKHVEDAAAELMKSPGEKATGAAAIYGMSQQIPDRSIIGEIVGAYLDSYYSTLAGIKKKAE